MNVGLNFFGFSLVIYILVALINLDLAIKSFMTFLNLFKKLVSVLILVFLLMFLTNLLLKPEKIIFHLGEGSGVRGWLISIGGGILSTGPIYMWYPLLADLKEKGMEDSLVATFLYNRAVKIPLIPMMIYYFGVNFVLVLTVYMIVFSVINGIIVKKIVRRIEWDENEDKNKNQSSNSF